MWYTHRLVTSSSVIWLSVLLAAAQQSAEPTARGSARLRENPQTIRPDQGNQENTKFSHHHHTIQQTNSMDWILEAEEQGKVEQSLTRKEKASHQELTKEEKGRQARTWSRRRRAGNQSSHHFTNNQQQQQTILKTTPSISQPQVDFLANYTRNWLLAYVCMHGWIRNIFPSVLQSDALQNHHRIVKPE
jgi:hypothetical protein